MAFWEPEKLAARRAALDCLKDNKGAHVAMQYVLADGAWADAWP